MIVVKVKTPFGKPLTLKWGDGKVAAKGDEEVLNYWKFLQSKGMYGKYGHIVDLEDCLFTDFIVALSNRVKYGDYKLGPKANEQLEKEAEREKKNPIPNDAVT